MPAVRVIASNRTLTDDLLRDATPPSAYRWSEAGEDADLTILIVPHVPDRAARERLTTLRARDYANLFLFSQEDHPIAWAPGVFTSMDARRASPLVAGGFYLPAHHSGPHRAGRLLDDLARRGPAAEHLWCFAGSVNTYPALRGQILALPRHRAFVRDTSGWNAEGAARSPELVSRAVGEHTRIIGSARFVLAPRGVGPSSIRLFEAMRAGRAPVIISDAWLPPPFVDWDACSVRVPEDRVADIPAILREREADAAALGRRAREVWEQRFSPQNAIHHLVACCLELQERRPSVLGRVRCAATAWPRRETLWRLKLLWRAERGHHRESTATCRT